MRPDRDDLFAQIGPVAPFRFDGEVARVFPDMIARSVPGYTLQLELLGQLGAAHIQAGDRVYDLGCSWGAASLAVARSLPDPRGVHFVGVDQSPEMLTYAHLAAERLRPSQHRFTWLKGDVATVPLETCGLILLNYTLQFVPLEAREALLQRCAQALRPGGALLLSEKTQAEDPAEAERQERYLERYKRAQGYSETEIANKREALRGVLVPETETIHRQRLARAGFGEVTSYFRGLAFVGWIAVRTAR